MKVYICDYCGKIVWSLFIILIDGRSISLCEKCYTEFILREKVEVDKVQAYA